MGLPHMLGEPGAVPELVGAGGRVPLLERDQIVLFAQGSEQATSFERDVIDFGSPRFGGLTITELNPDHTERGANST